MKRPTSVIKLKTQKTMNCYTESVIADLAAKVDAW